MSIFFNDQFFSKETLLKMHTEKENPHISVVVLDNNDGQITSADEYDSFMENVYEKERKLRWTGEFGWMNHYNWISGQVLEMLERVGKGGTIEFIGGTNDDLVSAGCIDLKKCSLTGISMAEYLSNAKNVIFKNISLKALTQTGVAFLHYLTVNDFPAVPVILVQEDSSRGIGSSLDILAEKIQVTTPSIGNFIQELSLGIDRLIKNVRPFLRDEEIHPEVIAGFSLMQITATLLPLQSKVLRSIHNQSHLISLEERYVFEKDLFHLVKKYNNWLIPFFIQNWFLKNPRGILTIFTDIGRTCYLPDTEGGYTHIKKRIDQKRMYSVFDMEELEKLKEFGFEINDIRKTKWEDEEDHYHEIISVQIQKRAAH